MHFFLEFFEMEVRPKSFPTFQNPPNPPFDPPPGGTPRGTPPGWVPSEGDAEKLENSWGALPSRKIPGKIAFLFKNKFFSPKIDYFSPKTNLLFKNQFFLTGLLLCDQPMSDPVEFCLDESGVALACQ